MEALKITRIIGNEGEGNAVLYDDDLLVDCGVAPNDHSGDVLKHYRGLERPPKYILLTHLHWDHARAAIPVAIHFGATILTTAFGKEWLMAWAEEDNMPIPTIKIFKDSVRFFVDDYIITPVEVAHSIPESFGFLIEKSGKKVFHLGDCKITGFHPDSRLENLNRMSEIGKKEVDLLIMDVLGVLRPGITPAEETVVENLVNLVMEKPESRHFILMFASNIRRLLHIWIHLLNLGVRVEFHGYSMERAKNIIGRITKSPIHRILNVPRYAAKTTVVFSTGCQAEENSAIWGVVKNEVSQGDRVYFSSAFIPESDEKELKKKLQRFRQLAKNIEAQGGELYLHEGQKKPLDLPDAKEAFLHVSGHESREGIARILKAISPRFVMPYHGSRTHYDAFTKMVREINKESSADTDKEIFVFDLAHSQTINI